MDLNITEEKSVKCYQKYREIFNSTAMCPPVWDDIFCWPPTTFGQMVSVPCTIVFKESLNNYKSDQSSPLIAIRKCAPNGTWDWNNWTNYSQCFDLLQAFENDISNENGSTFATILRYLVLTCSSASVICLVISIVVFSIFKPLRCERNTVHKNLCIALLLQSMILALVSSHALFIPETDDYSHTTHFLNSTFLCKLMKGIGIYASISTVYWMFIEGLSLHTTLYVTPFYKNKHLMKVYYFIGWGIPLVLLGIWIIISESRNHPVADLCWKGYGTSSLIWIITGPMIIALTLNFLFLINIIRLLISKLSRSLEKKKAFKMIKATAFLIPLLGLEHLVFCINPRGTSPQLESTYIIINATIQSLQGIAVSTLYCFLNHEVRKAMQSSMKRKRLSNSTAAELKALTMYEFSENLSAMRRIMNRFSSDPIRFHGK
ncbi:corticotropin-releasing factor receptor 1-like protein [Dinothrombium tinctorium]|uniref:Corticotropin-releasing factor receptor 1-like protein n=1 Tax=Dinothrombium tinctorium TaxID=1965070 RepID=A0A3S3PD78_9ACAR|nr:corticotropin-releasing factor receptor 1-like protein [Dinothrombium tinctorium]